MVAILNLLCILFLIWVGLKAIGFTSRSVYKAGLAPGCAGHTFEGLFGHAVKGRSDHQRKHFWCDLCSATYAVDGRSGHWQLIK